MCKIMISKMRKSLSGLFQYLLKFPDMIWSNDEAKLRELVNGSIPASIVMANIQNKIMLNMGSILSDEPSECNGHTKHLEMCGVTKCVA